MDLGLHGKKILVTGSTKGIGYATAKMLAQEGADPVIVGRNEADVTEKARELSSQYGVHASGIAIDLFEKDSAETLFRKTIDAIGTIDILINCAGIWPTAYIKEMEVSDFERTMYINLEVPCMLSKYCMNHMIENDIRGKIIYVTSQAAFYGATSGHAHYAASKSGMLGFMISQAREAAPYGINVNAIAPGIVRTPMFQKRLEEAEPLYTKRIPIGRIAEASDVAKGIVFLASNMADYYTGITLDATGGMLMR